MKYGPWSDRYGQTTWEERQAAQEAARAIYEAQENLPDVDDLILFDLQTPVPTRFVAFPAKHVHDQDCGRA